MSKTPITYANAQTDLPGSDFIQKLRHLRLQRQFAANSNQPDQHSEPQSRSNPTMVEQEQPHPVLRPSPQLAADVDAASFNRRWEAERQRHIPSYCAPLWYNQKTQTRRSYDTKSRNILQGEQSIPRD